MAADKVCHPLSVDTLATKLSLRSAAQSWHVVDFMFSLSSPSILGNCIWILAVFLRVSQTSAVPSKMAQSKKLAVQKDGWLDESM